MRYAYVALLALGVGCKPNDTGIHEQEGHDTWYQAPTNKVDILFVIDDSHSMAEEQASLASGFASFISEIVNTNTDFQLGVITTSFEVDDPLRAQLIGDPPILTGGTPNYQQLFQDRVQVGTTGSDQEKGLEAAAYALSPLQTTNRDSPNYGFVRDESFLLTIILSDENDCSDDYALSGMGGQACYDNDDLLVPVEEFVEEFRTYKDEPSYVQVGVIVGPEKAQGCDDAAPGFRYWDFAEQLGGLQGNICDADYASIMYELGLNATGILESFQLTNAAKPETLKVYVTVAGESTEIFEDASNGWTYDPETYYLHFHGDAVPPRGAQIDADYTIQSGG